MILQAFSVYDSAAQAFLRPFFAETVGLAIRSFSDAVNDPQSPMSQHAEDYVLWRIGSFQQDTGSLMALEHAEKLGVALNFKREV